MTEVNAGLILTLHGEQKESGRIDSQFTFCTIDNNYMYTMHIIKKI